MFETSFLTHRRLQFIYTYMLRSDAVNYRKADSSTGLKGVSSSVEMNREDASSL